MPQQSLSEQIRQAAKASGMSQNAMADAIGADKATISRFINGVLGLSQQKLDALAELLGLTLATAASDRFDRKTPPLTASRRMRTKGRRHKTSVF